MLSHVFEIYRLSFLNISKLYFCHQLSSLGNICSTNHSHPGLQVFHKTRNNYCSTTAGGKALVKMIKSCLALEDTSSSCEAQCHIWDIPTPLMEKLPYQELMNHYPSEIRNNLLASHLMSCHFTINYFTSHFNPRVKSKYTV